MARGIDDSRTRCESDLGGLKSVKLLKTWWAGKKKKEFMSIVILKDFVSILSPISDSMLIRAVQKKPKFRNDHPLSANPQYQWRETKKPGEKKLAFLPLITHDLISH